MKPTKPKEYYIRRTDEKGPWQKVRGYPVRVSPFKRIDLFLCKTEFGWRVTEGTTGSKVVGGLSREQALATLLRRTKDHKITARKFQAEIEIQVQARGLSPRYQP